jgi:hypothetical protein
VVGKKLSARPRAATWRERQAFHCPAFDVGAPPYRNPARDYADGRWEVVAARPAPRGVVADAIHLGYVGQADQIGGGLSLILKGVLR